MKPDRGFWSVLVLILLAVLAPTACILYFMNEALASQSAAAHQKLAEAYRAQLRAAQRKIDAFWEKRVAALDALEGPTPAARFEEAVRKHLADSVIYFGSDGAPAYPSRPAAPSADPAAARSDWQAARELESSGRLAEAGVAYGQIADREQDGDLAGRALQAQLRCLAQSLKAGGSVTVGPSIRGTTYLTVSYDTLIEKSQTGRYARAHDLEGRLIRADELLFAIRTIPDRDPRRVQTIERLHRLVADYQAPIPSPQRLFLMEELRALTHGGAGDFATYDAERRAAQYLEGGRVRSGDGALRLSDIDGIWKITSPSNRAMALFGDRALGEVTGAILEEVLPALDAPQDLTIGINSPGSGGVHDITMNAGARMPGFQLVLDIKDTANTAAIARRQRLSYLWIGFLVIATIAVTALIAGRAFLRQMRLARMKTDLVATVSHELKTPLAGMQLLVDTLLDSPDHDPVRTREYLELISRENERLSRLIANFLTFSRMERNRAQFDLTRVEPAGAVRAAIEAVGDRFAVEVSIAPDLPALRADSGALVTVLLNLLDNAYKYTGDDRHIVLRAHAEEGHCCFAVEDNGIGIAPREQKKIFRRFYQVERRLTTHSGGVGLGLSIVEFTVKAHGGTIRVESRPGAGSRFVVSLPAVPVATEVHA